MNCEARTRALSVTEAGMNNASLVRRQTTTRIALWPEEGGRSTMWSQDIEDQGRVGVGRGLSRPSG